jgi:hypothetical protein
MPSSVEATSHHSTPGTSRRRQTMRLDRALVGSDAVTGRLSPVGRAVALR